MGKINFQSEPILEGDEVCVLCGFNISKWVREIGKEGRQWAGSFQHNGCWICGCCGDELRGRD